MKKSFNSMLILMVLPMFFLTTSCKKKEGCMSPNALNYDEEAEEDNGTCVYAADKLTGTWKVEETVDGKTETYTATITKILFNQIEISTDRQNPPVYHLEDLQLQVNWAAKTLDLPGTTVDGTIRDENDFTVEYYYGTRMTVYDVELHYTRK